MKIEKVKIEQLVSDPANVRVHSDRNIEAIKASLARFGQQKPLVIDKGNVVRAGNGTLEAAKRLGWNEVECVRSRLTGSDLTAFAIADNRTAELAEWSAEIGAMLDQLRVDLPDVDFGALAFDELADLGLPKIQAETGAGTTDGTEKLRLKFGDYAVVISEDERDELARLLEAYVAQHGVDIGFAHWLCQGRAS
jgi:hypothetical protein